MSHRDVLFLKQPNFTKKCSLSQFQPLSKFSSQNCCYYYIRTSRGTWMAAVAAAGCTCQGIPAIRSGSRCSHKGLPSSFFFPRPEQNEKKKEEKPRDAEEAEQQTPASIPGGCWPRTPPPTLYVPHFALYLNCNAFLAASGSSTRPPLVSAERGARTMETNPAQIGRENEGNPRFWPRGLIRKLFPPHPSCLIIPLLLLSLYLCLKWLVGILKLYNFTNFGVENR